MTQLIIFVLLGLGSGAFIAGLGLSLVISYRGSGTINLGAGATALVGAYVYYDLRVNGGLVLPPIPFVAAQLSFGKPVAAPVALALAIGAAALIGALFDVLVLNRLRTAAPLSRLVASLGLLLLLQSSMLLRFGVDAVSAPSVLGQGSVTVLKTPIPTAGLVFAGIVIVLAGLLAVVYQRSRFGVATAAAAENEMAAQRFGLAPWRISLVNSVLAATLAGTLGVLFAAMSQLDNTTLVYAVIPALAAALIGRFQSFLVVAAAGFGLGVVEAAVQWAQTMSWFPTAGGLPLSGIYDVIVFVVIAVVVFSREDAVPARGSATETTLPPSPVPRHVGRNTVGLVLTVILALELLPSDYRQGLITSLIGAVLCLSLVVITGFVGQVSVLHAGLAGVSALVIAKVGLANGLPFPIAPILGVLAALALGLVAALPALRVRGVQLAIVTMAGALALSSLLLGNTQLGFNPLSTGAAVPKLFGLNLAPTNSALTIASGRPGALFGMFCLVVCAALMLAVVALRRGVLGQRMLAVRSNERAAAAAGVDTRQVKLVAYTVSSLIAGVAGVLFSYDYGSSSANNYDITIALAFIGFAYVGGISTIRGAMIGGLVVTGSITVQLIDNLIGLSPNATLVLAGYLLLATVVANPGGIALAPAPWKIVGRVVQRAGVRVPRAVNAGSAP